MENERDRKKLLVAKEDVARSNRVTRSNDNYRMELKLC